MNTALNYQPEVLVDTADLSREDWLDYRRLGIGGSDAAAIMGLSPFATIRDLYFDKIGVTPVIEEEEENWVAKEVGHRLEDLVAMIFAKKTGLEVFPVRKMFRHPLYCKTRGCQMANYEIHQNVYKPIKVNCEVTKWMYHLIQTNLTEKQLEKLKQEYERRYLRHGK